MTGGAAPGAGAAPPVTVEDWGVVSSGKDACGASAPGVTCCQSSIHPGPLPGTSAGEAVVAGLSNEPGSSAGGTFCSERPTENSCGDVLAGAELVASDNASRWLLWVETVAVVAAPVGHTSAVSAALGHSARKRPTGVARKCSAVRFDISRSVKLRVLFPNCRRRSAAFLYVRL